MEELNATIAKLEKPDERIVEVLQEIGTMLLSEYVLQIGDIIIEPLWVEAYYANNDKGFLDPFIHGNEKQKEFDVLYFHHKTDDSRSGVDVCLGNNSYSLSYLLKYTLVDGVFTTQSQLSGKIRKAYEALPPESKCSVIKKQHHPADVIGYTERRGLKVKDTDKDAARKKEYKSLPSLAKHTGEYEEIVKRDIFLRKKDGTPKKDYISHCVYLPGLSHKHTNVCLHKSFKVYGMLHPSGRYGFDPENYSEKLKELIDI